jgi:preprotein translocase subunit SecF
MKKITYLFLSISLFTTSIVAQENKVEQPELDAGTVEQKFDYIINKSTQYKEFQLIRKSSILKVKAHALDSANTLREELNNLKRTTAEAKNKADLLATEVEQLKEKNEAIAQDVNSISFIGIPLSKTAYNSFVWIMILALLGGLLTFLFLFQKSHLLTKSAQDDLEKTNSDFESFRKKALIKEQETMRKLQDEINKQSY